MSLAGFSHTHKNGLRAIDAHHATITSAPDFAYYHCTRRIRNAELEGLDLSSLRVAMSGGEPVRAQHFQSFYRRFSEYGLRDDVFLSVYGLSEGTLGVCFGEIEAPFQVDGIRQGYPRALWSGSIPLGPEGAPTPWTRLHLVSAGQARWQGWTCA